MREKKDWMSKIMCWITFLWIVIRHYRKLKPLKNQVVKHARDLLIRFYVILTEFKSAAGKMVSVPGIGFKIYLNSPDKKAKYVAKLLQKNFLFKEYTFIALEIKAKSYILGAGGV